MFVVFVPIMSLKVSGSNYGVGFVFFCPVLVTPRKDRRRLSVVSYESNFGRNRILKFQNSVSRKAGLSF